MVSGPRLRLWYRGMHNFQFHTLQDFPLCPLLVFVRQTAAHHVQLRPIPFVFNKDRSFVRTICPKETFLHLCMPLANCCCCLRFVEIPHKLPGNHLQQSAIPIIPSQKVRLDTMDQTTEAKSFALNASIHVTDPPISG